MLHSKESKQQQRLKYSFSNRNSYFNSNLNSVYCKFGNKKKPKHKKSLIEFKSEATLENFSKVVVLLQVWLVCLRNKRCYTQKLSCVKNDTYQNRYKKSRVAIMHDTYHVIHLDSKTPFSWLCTKRTTNTKFKRLQ